MSLITDQSCGKCKYFTTAEAQWGFCHRTPPQVTNIPIKADANGNPITLPVSSFPPVQSDWWCGEYKPKLLDA